MLKKMLMTSAAVATVMAAAAPAHAGWQYVYGDIDNASTGLWSWDFDTQSWKTIYGQNYVDRLNAEHEARIQEWRDYSAELTDLLTEAREDLEASRLTVAAYFDKIEELEAELATANAELERLESQLAVGEVVEALVADVSVAVSALESTVTGSVLNATQIEQFVATGTWTDANGTHTVEDIRDFEPEAAALMDTINAAREAANAAAMAHDAYKGDEIDDNRFNVQGADITTETIYSTQSDGAVLGISGEFKINGRTVDLGKHRDDNTFDGEIFASTGELDEWIDAFEAGYESGYEDGYLDGFKDGYAAGVADTLAGQ